MTEDHDDEIDSTLPQVVQDFLRSGANLEEIRLDDRGEWTHEGLIFENPRIEKLFSRHVGRTQGGTWVLEIGRFTYPITVEDTGFFVDKINWSHSPPLLYLSDDTTEDLDIDSLHYEPGGRLYCRIKNGRFRARFKHSAYHSVADFLSEQDGKVVFCFDGREKILADADSR